MKKVYSFLLILSMMLPILTSCGNDTTSQESDSPPEAVTEQSEIMETKPVLPSTLTKQDWGGKEYWVLGATNTTYEHYTTTEITAEEQTGEGFNDAVYTRNMKLENELNVTVHADLTQEAGKNDIYIKALHDSGEDKFHLMITQVEKVYSLMVENYLLDMTTLPYIDFDASYWNPNATKQLSLGNRLFFASSDFLIRDKSRLSLLFFNKDMINDFSLTNPVDLVREGTWTLDVLSEYSEIVAADIDGNGAMDPEDRFGIVAGGRPAYRVMYFAAGGKDFIKDKNDILLSGLKEERNINIIEKIVSNFPNKTLLFATAEDFQGRVDGDFWYAPNNIFNAGNALFISNSLDGYSSFSDSEVNYNVVPFPKYDISENTFHSPLSNMFGLMVVPNICQDTDFAAYMIEALSYASTDTSLYAFLEAGCKRKYTYDETGVEMLTLICETAVYTPSEVYNISGVLDTIQSLLTTDSGNVVSKIDSTATAVQTQLDKLTQDLSKLG